MKRSIEWIQSWLGVFGQEAHVIEVDTIDELREVLAEGPCKVVGSMHSYNRAAIADTVVKLGRDFKQLEYHPENQTCTVGAACTVREVMEFLMEHDRRVVNFGNHMAQTYVGAAIGGTVGFGESASVVDSIIEYEYMEDADG